MAKIKTGSVEEGQTPVRSGYTVEQIRERGMFLASDGVVEWNGSQIDAASANIRFYIQTDDGRYFFHQIANADLPLTLADGEVLVARPDTSLTANDTLVAGTHPNLSPGEYDIVALASTDTIDTTSRDHVVLFQRSGSDLISPISKQLWQSGTHAIVGLGPYAGPGTGGQVLTSNGSGNLPTYQDATTMTAVFGDGHDGNNTVSSSVFLSTGVGDTYYNDLTMNSGGNLETNSLRLFVSGTLSLNGDSIIQIDGADGADGTAGGGGGSSLSNRSLGQGSIGGSADAGNGGNITVSGGGLGGAGGANGTGTAGGSAGTAIDGSLRSGIQDITQGTLMISTLAGTTSGINKVGGGTGGGAGKDESTSVGGGGGEGAGVMVICAREIVVDGSWTGRISANGGNGGDGEGVTSNDAGGGGGGGGGVVAIFYQTITDPNNLVDATGSTGGGGGPGSNVTATGGTGGAGGNSDPLNAGAAGADGNDGTVIVIKVTS